MVSSQDNAHLYRGREFSSQELLFLRPSFGESYRESIQTNARKTFLIVYENSERLHKTFTEFDRDVSQVAAHLGESAASKRFFVSVGGNSYCHLVYLTAAMLNGMTVCPVNPEEGFERVSRKISSVGEPVALYSDCGFSGAQPMTLFSEQKKPRCFSAQALRPGQPLICVFTSGSTGYSKLVEQMEQNVLANVDSLIDHHKLSEGLVMATSMPIFHVSAFEFSFLCALLSGSTLVLYQKFDLLTVSQSIKNDHVQILSAVPILVRVFLDRKEDFQAFSGPYFKYAVCGASFLSKEVALEFLSTFQKPLVQGYGLSEAVQSSTCMPIDLELREYQQWYGNFDRPSIGVELRGNEIQILDDQSQPVPAGVEGEISIRGFNVMRSYRGEPPLPGAYLRTGDLGYFQVDQNGIRYFFVSGRKKDVLKRQGETVSLEEIDGIVSQEFNSTEDAIAVGFKHEISDEEIGLAVKAESLDHVLKKIKAMPFFIRPKVIFVTDDDLRTPSGKPQRWKFVPIFSRFSSTVFNRAQGPIVIRS